MMNSGKYWIGDLCYVMHGEWEEVCDIIIDGHNVLDGEFNLKDGRRFAIYSTQYGDGEYATNEGKSLGVDAGCIGCIKVEDIDQDNPRNNLNLGMIVDFDSAFSTRGYEVSRSDWDGVIHIGHVEVYTGDMYEEEEDYYEDEEDEWV
jgi:hypothetical protein